MPSYAQAPHCPITLVDTFQRTSSRVSKIPSLMRLTESVKRSTESSEYLTRIGQFEGAVKEVEGLHQVSDDWNSYGSPAPRRESIEAAIQLLNSLRSISQMPTKVLPSAEGGVAMTFTTQTRNRAVIETLNNGEAFILLYDLGGNNETLDWNVAEADRLRHLESLRSHLRS